jgi:hypothetical protein
MLPHSKIDFTEPSYDLFSRLLNHMNTLVMSVSKVS